MTGWTSELHRRIEERRQRWNSATPNPDPALSARAKFVARLVHKQAGADYARALDLPLPRRLAVAGDPGELDFDALPERVAIKPDNQANNAGVMLFAEGRELFRGHRVPREARADYVRKVLDHAGLSRPGLRLIAEELLEDASPGFAIPRDFKVFVAGGRGHVVQVVDRNGPKREWKHRFYARDWVPYGDFQTSNRLDEAIPAPRDLPALLTLADRIAADLGCFMRLDFYLTPRGPIFGEFTSYPNAGRNFTPLGSAVLCDLIERYPDPF